jgi:hypothetical protein
LLLGIELGTGKLIAVFDLKLGSVLDNKLKCRAVVIAITKNIINSFGAEIGAVLGSRLGTILGIALGMEMHFKLRT